MLTLCVQSNVAEGAAVAGLWDGVIYPKHEARILRVLQGFASAPELRGELLGLRVKSDDDRWLDVSGPMLGCEIESDGNKYTAKVRFAADRWRTW